MMTTVFQEVLICMGWFVLAFAWGAFSYWALMKTEDMAEVMFTLLAVVLCLVTSVALWWRVIPIIVVAALLCALPAWLEHQVNSRYEWKWYFGKLLLTTYQSFMVGTAAVLIAVDAGMPIATKSIFPLVALAAGFALTPPAISVFRWLWHTSKMRPGLDAPLDHVEFRPFSQEENPRA